MSIIPGDDNTGLTTFKGALPPVAPYQDQQRTCIIAEWPKSIWNDSNDYGFQYAQDGALAEVDLGAMSNVDMATIKTSIEGALKDVLKDIQGDSSGNWGVGNSYFAYELTLLTGFYYVTKIGLFDVSATNWIGIGKTGISLLSPVRFYMIAPCESIAAPTVYNFSQTIQWGFHPLYQGAFS